MTERDCKHGRLARKCEICELEADLKELRETFMHTFRSPQSGGYACDVCGLDIRNPIHRRANDPAYSRLDRIANRASMQG